METVSSVTLWFAVVDKIRINEGVTLACRWAEKTPDTKSCSERVVEETREHTQTHTQTHALRRVCVCASQVRGVRVKCAELKRGEGCDDTCKDKEDNVLFQQP